MSDATIGEEVIVIIKEVDVLLQGLDMKGMSISELICLSYELDHHC